MVDDLIAERWLHITARLTCRWRKLTARDVAYPYGSSEYLARVLQDRYGIGNQEALLQVYAFELALARDLKHPFTVARPPVSATQKAAPHDKQRQDCGSVKTVAQQAAKALGQVHR